MFSILVVCRYDIVLDIYVYMRGTTEVAVTNCNELRKYLELGRHVPAV